MTPGAAVAAVYLCSQLEYLFRVLGRYLSANGEWITEELRAEAHGAFPGLLPRGKRMNRVEIAYKLFLLNNESPTAQEFARLETEFPKRQVVNFDGSPRILNDVGERVGFMRDPAAHGFFGDVSSEAWIYALLHALVYHSL